MAKTSYGRNRVARCGDCSGFDCPGAVSGLIIPVLVARTRTIVMPLVPHYGPGIELQGGHLRTKREDEWCSLVAFRAIVV